MKHPFLDSEFYIRWQELKPEHVEADISKALENAQKAIDTITEVEPSAVSFQNTLLALEEATRPLDEAWGKVSHLDSVDNSPELRKAYNSILPRVSEFYTHILLNEKLWNVLQAFSKTEEAAKLTGAHKRFLEETLSDFEENGAQLPEEDKEKLKAINAKLAALTQKYSENVLDATNAWEFIIDKPEELAGLPESAKNQAASDAKAHEHGDEKNPKWGFTLHAPSYMPLMQYLDNDNIRHTAWRASNAVGYEKPYNNTELTSDILKLRSEKAALLGKDHFADLVLKRRMATSGEKALQFTEDMHNRVKPFFDAETETLERFKAEKTTQNPEPLEPWETAYWAEKQRQALYSFDEEALRPYFELEAAVKGMFMLTENIFGIQVKEHTGKAETWHPEVKLFDIFDEDGTHLGSFYTDWHPRAPKRGGAWMNHLITGGPLPDGSHAPHLGLICGNLTPPAAGNPALLTHRELETVFHEFGHLLHHILGSVPIKSLNGTNVAWDFVELPSQIMENWCWERESLDLFAKHYKTREPIPEELFQKMKRARNYLSGMSTMRQLGFGKMDLELHMHYDDFASQDLESVIKSLLADYTPRYKTEPLSIVRRFSHLFSSPTGYAAGYYSYKWAEVLDADAFTRFQDEGILSARVGKSFREHILSKGNSEKPEILFRNFMGRDPDLAALLKRSGLYQES